MVSWLSPRRSAITCDLGAGGLRACQLQQRGGQFVLCDNLEFESQHSAETAAPPIDPAQIERLIGRGSFSGRDVTVVLSPPEVQFFPMQLPRQALAQPPERVEQALKWEVARESRKSGDDLEVRYWELSAGRGQQANVMAAVMSSAVALQWCRLLRRKRLTLRRIDVSPCALTRLARRVWTPKEDDLWGVLDLGLRQSILTVVVGAVPTYIRSLSISTHDWTRQLAQAFEVSAPLAEQLKREHGIQPSERGFRPPSPGTNLLNATDLSSAICGVLRESLRTLGHEIGRCFSYVMQGFPDASVRRLFLAGGGASLRGLSAALKDQLSVPVSPLLSGAGPDAVPWEHPLSGVHFGPQAAASFGGAILDLETRCAAR